MHFHLISFASVYFLLDKDAFLKGVDEMKDFSTFLQTTIKTSPLPLCTFEQIFSYFFARGDKNIFDRVSSIAGV